VCSFKFRWAHRPLCGRFRSGVIKLGNVHLCRSCICAYCGILTCGILLMLFQPSVSRAVIVLAGLSVPTLVLSGPWCYKKLSRVTRDILRWTMGSMIALCVYLLICRELMIALPVTAVLVTFWRLYFKARRKRRLHACDNCEELSGKGVCSGCRLQAEGIRRYEDTATRLYLASSQIPNICSKSNKTFL
jgi:hypothetical protein